MQRLMSVLFGVLLLLSSTPNQALAQTIAVPALKWPASGRLDYATVTNGIVENVGKIEFISGSTPQDVRFHEVEHFLQENKVIEGVVSNGTYYSRVNTDTRWTVRSYVPGDDFYPAGDPLSGRPGNMLRGVRIGEVDIAGEATTHYQVHLSPSTFGPLAQAVKIDVFIGNNDGYVHKGQLTLTGPVEQNGPVVDYIFVYRVYDFNVPVVVGTPPADLVD